jgi:hypothetical protein
LFFWHFARLSNLKFSESFDQFQLMKLTILNILLLVFFPLNIWATEWFVDNTANGLNNGQSWGNAWESFADINWPEINPGDTIYISGGAVSKTYYEKLTVSVSGTSGNPITITAGVDANHNGAVIIDGGDARNCIVVDNKKYINISYIQFRNGGQNSGNGTIHIDNCQAIKVEFCNFEEINTHGAVFIEQSSNCIIGYNTITTLTNTSVQVDGIYGQKNNGNFYEYNHISVLNNNNGPHCDAIQLYQGNNYTIRGNTILVENNSDNNKQGIFCTDNSGTSYIYNNLVIYDTMAWGSLIAHWNVNTGFTGTVRIYNNTSVSLSEKGHCVQVVGDNNAIIKNNIFWRQNSTITPATYGAGDKKINFIVGNVDYNIYYCDAGTDIIYYNGSSINLDEWQDLGHGTHSKRINPSLSNDYRPNSEDAPPVDEGINLSNIFADDIDGTPRPQGAAWDIGAYEYYIGMPSPDSGQGGSGGGGCFITAAGFESNSWVSLMTAAGCIIMLLMPVIWKVISYQIVLR